MENRIIECEKRIAFLELACDELNAALLDQQKIITQQQAQLQLLKDRASQENLVINQEDEIPPPHY